MIKTSIQKDLQKYINVTIEIKPKHELRIIHMFLEHIYIRLLAGKAEIYGAQMTKKYYQLPSDLPSFYVYSLQGGTVEITYPKSFKNLKYYTHEDEDRFADGVVSLN